jgi:hypothetical protein
LLYEPHESMAMALRELGEKPVKLLCYGVNLD